MQSVDHNDIFDRPWQFIEHLKNTMLKYEYLHQSFIVYYGHQPSIFIALNQYCVMKKRDQYFL